MGAIAAPGIIPNNLKLISNSGLLLFGASGDFRLGRLAAAALVIPHAPGASANRGLLNLGSGPFDGATAGFFVGSASGTHLAVNAASGFAGNLLDLQVAGGSIMRVSAAGELRLTATGVLNFSDTNVQISRTGNGLTLKGYDGVTAIRQTGSASLLPTLTVTPTSAGGGAAESSTLLINAATLTITGSYADNRFTRFSRPTITAASALTITNAPTVYIENAPLAAGSAILTNPYALWVDDGVSRFDGLVQTVLSATGGAGLRLPHGAAPTSPVDGDVWTTTAGMFVQINGVTKTVTLL